MFNASAPLGRAQLLGTYSYTGKRYPDLGNWPDYEVPSYARLDLRASLISPSEMWRLTLYVQNALDEVGLTEFVVNSVISGTFATGTLTEPRQFGMIVQVDF